MPRADAPIPIARDLAARLHAGQIRKYTGAPYFTHLEEVANICRNVTASPAIICAAYLHDAIEDQGALASDIMGAFPDPDFGAAVAALVIEVTDVSRPSDGNRAARKAKDRDHLAKAAPDAQTIKLADLISNTRSIVEHDPAFARVYLAEKDALLDVLTRGNGVLRIFARGYLQDGKHKIGMV